jgi:muramoyltetrapeptide carboxypeptidase
VRLGRHVFARDGYFAGSDSRRAEDLAAMIQDDEVRAIHFARGGWGMSRILHAVPWATLARRPKLLIGYSDLTSLFAPALDRAGLATIYGPLVTELGRGRSFDRASLERAYFHPARPLRIPIPKSGLWRSGSAEGRAAGGCLTLLAHLAGTDYAPRLRGRVLLLEEIQEPPYRLDRLLTQMELAGMLDGLRGVLIGSMTDCDPSPGSAPTHSARDILLDHLGGRGIPVIAGMRFGHLDRKRSIPIGFRVRIDAKRREVVFRP